MYPGGWTRNLKNKLYLSRAVEERAFQCELLCSTAYYKSHSLAEPIQVEVDIKNAIDKITLTSVLTIAEESGLN